VRKLAKGIKLYLEILEKNFPLDLCLQGFMDNEIDRLNRINFSAVLDVHFLDSDAMTTEQKLDIARKIAHYIEQPINISDEDNIIYAAYDMIRNFLLDPVVLESMVKLLKIKSNAASLLVTRLAKDKNIQTLLDFYRADKIDAATRILLIEACGLGISHIKEAIKKVIARK